MPLHDREGPDRHFCTNDLPLANKTNSVAVAVTHDDTIALILNQRDSDWATGDMGWLEVDPQGALALAQGLAGAAHEAMRRRELRDGGDEVIVPFAFGPN